jgi:hypothetical protein
MPDKLINFPLFQIFRPPLPKKADCAINKHLLLFKSYIHMGSPEGFPEAGEPISPTELQPDMSVESQTGLYAGKVVAVTPRGYTMAWDVIDGRTVPGKPFTTPYPFETDFQFRRRTS